MLQRKAQMLSEVELLAKQAHKVSKLDIAFVLKCCKGLGKRVVPKLREYRLLSPDSLWPQGTNSHNLGTTLLPSPVLLFPCIKSYLSQPVLHTLLSTSNIWTEFRAPPFDPPTTTISRVSAAVVITLQVWLVRGAFKDGAVVQFEFGPMMSWYTSLRRATPEDYVQGWAKEWVLGCVNPPPDSLWSRELGRVQDNSVHVFSGYRYVNIYSLLTFLISISIRGGE